MKLIYATHATTISGREGHTQSDNLSLKLSPPGSKESGTNPEQLFACAYSACFGSALSQVAKKKEITLQNLKIRADVSLNQDDGGYFLGVIINAYLPNIEQSLAEILVKDAHKICPYSKAIRNNVEVKLMANDKEVS